MNGRKQNQGLFITARVFSDLTGREQKFLFVLWNLAAFLLSSAALCAVSLSFAIGRFENLFYIFLGYIRTPEIFLLNWLPLLLVQLFFFALTNRQWSAFLITAAAALGMSIGNYFKLIFRSDPFTFSDLSSVRAGLSVAGEYDISIDWRILLAIVFAVTATLILFFFARCRMKRLSARAVLLLLAVLPIWPMWKHVYSDGNRYYENSYRNFSYWEDGGKARYNGVNSRAEAYFEDSRLVFGSVRMGFAADMEPYEYYLDQNMQWQGWDFRSRWFSTFANMRYDTFNESYFPTKGLRVSLDTRYVFDGYSIYMEDEGMEDGESYESDVLPYSVGVANASFALPLGSRLVLQPTMYFGWQTEYPGHMNFIHTLGVGGMMAGRYIDNQIPYFGFNTGFQACGSFMLSTQVDLRYRINHKNFFTLRAGMFQDKDRLVELVNTKPTGYAFGAEIGQKTILGPFRLGVQWCSIRGFSVSGSIGFYF